MPDSEDRSVLSRWSRRKLAAREGLAEAPEPEAGASESEPAPSAEQEQAPEVAAAREAELRANREAAEAVDLAKLNENSDFSVFMKEGVPALLRRKAMAVLWRSSPVFANIDGLVDYDEDYARPDIVVKTVKSAWEAGRGYLKEKPGETAEGERAAGTPEATGDASEERAPVEEAAQESEAAFTEPQAQPEQTPEDAVAAEPGLEPEPEPVPRVSLRRRLMMDEKS